MEQSKDDVTLDTLKESVLAILDQTTESYKYSRKRLRKLRKDFINLDQQTSAKKAIYQLSDMISGIQSNKILVKIIDFTKFC